MNFNSWKAAMFLSNEKWAQLFCLCIQVEDFTENLEILQAMHSWIIFSIVNCILSYDVQ